MLAKTVAGLPPRVVKGTPAGQHFGIGGVWARAMTPAARPSWVKFSKAKVCGEGSPCTSTSVHDADTKYAAGPVYLAHIDDWRAVAEQWWRMMPRVHAQYPQLLAEMYAFTMAVANLTLPWALVSHFMVSDPGTMSPTESWPWIEDLTDSPDGPSAVCNGATATTLPTATRDRINGPSLPTVLHYCQRYLAADHIFAKRKVPHDLFSCEGQVPTLMPFNATTILRELGPKPSVKAIRTSFMLCHLIPMVNSALVSYRRDVCNETQVR